MGTISISSIAVRLGLVRPLESLAEASTYESEYLARFSLDGLTTFSEIATSLQSAIVDCAAETLAQARSENIAVERIILCGDVSSHIETSASMFFAGLLAQLGLAGYPRLMLAGNASGDIFAGIEVARDMIASGAARNCLIVSAFKKPLADPRRLTNDGLSIRCDGVVSLLVLPAARGELEVETFIRVDHEDWMTFRPTVADGPRDPQRALDVFALSRQMIQELLASIVPQQGQLGDVALVTTMNRSAGRAATFIPEELDTTIYKGDYRGLNLFVAGQPFLEVYDEIASGRLIPGKRVLVYAPTPHANFGMVLHYRG